MAIVILLFSCNEGFSQNTQTPSMEWQKCFGGSFADYGNSIIQTSNDGFISVGYTQSFDFDAINNHSQTNDAFVVKLSDNYSTEWIKCYGGSNSDNFNSVIETSDNCFLLSGITSSIDGDVANNHGGTDGWIVKIDSAGEIIWQKCYGGTGASDVIFKTIQINDGGFICAGYSNSNDGDVVNPEMIIKGWIFKMDSLGVIEWSRCYGDTIKSKFYDIIPTNDGGYLVTGKKILNGFNVANIWIVKLNELGNMEWQIDYGTIYEEIYNIIQLSNGSYIGVGETVDSVVYHSNVGLVLNISESGVLNWVHKGTNYWGRYTSVDVVSDSCFVLGGYGINGANSSTDFLLVKMTNAGNIVWEQYYGGIHTEKLYSFQQTTDQGFILTGITSSEWAGYYGDYDMWIVKLSAETGISENDPIINFQIYPNPTPDILTIQVDPTLLNIPYNLYSITGQLVLSGNVTSETMMLNLGSFSEGIYLFQIGNQTKKIVKIK
jgi:hypothetical protein